MEFPSDVAASCSTTYQFGGLNKVVATADKGSFALEPAFSYEGIQGTSGGQPINTPAIDVGSNSSGR